MNDAGRVRIIKADALELPIESESVDLIVTSPPYFNLRRYQDAGTAYAGQIGCESSPAEFVAALVAATREMARVLKPSGSIFVNLGDKYGKSKSLLSLPHRYAIAVMDEIGLLQRAEIVWAKSNGMPEPVSDRVRRSHEHWFHFTRSADYFATLDPLRVPYTGDRALSRRVKKPGQGQRDQRVAWDTPNERGSLPGSVWTVATQPLKVPADLGVTHTAAFPMEWPKRLIKGWCPEGGTVLDPFGGTGTTALVASALGRTGISVDLSHDYCRIARWRTSDPTQIARAQEHIKHPGAPK